MNKIKLFHEKISSPKFIGILFILVLIFFAIFRLFTPEFERLSNGIKIPDVAIAFNGNNLYSLFASYGESARSYYGYIQFVDAFYPLVYGFFFLAVIVFYINKFFKDDSKFRYLFIIPYLAMIFDYIENTTIFIMNKTFPEQFGLVADISFISSNLKWIFFLSSVLIVFSGTLLFIARKFSKK